MNGIDPETFIFFLSGFTFTDTDDSGQQGKGGGLSFIPPAHEHSDIYFATLHVRWLSHIFNRTACI